MAFILCNKPLHTLYHYYSQYLSIQQSKPI
ncbi:Hypothetical protein FNO222_1440 [Francisella orientalis]|uniref:Uncharacterized protein n=1 Tax=Francisella orientalis TaxID=299583 RepID=A0ABM5U744_9GAMM|nr:hypothetical protein FNO12_1427 [Francisella orientalis FNO12]AKN87526.1 Hypothetical protein FNO24_1429 [Francisella orientalis FNO24]AKN89064.1 Hypothetical protein FNO190_1427 [Francisella orientalis]AKU05823.1 Hypothetical protein FNO01_1427 [Francisella orientalis]QEN20739.1 Hypothetical protein FNO39_1440 [Francisella orientalis]